MIAQGNYANFNNSTENTEISLNLEEIKQGNLSFCCERQRRRCPGGQVDFNKREVIIVDDYNRSVKMTPEEFEELNARYQQEKHKFMQEKTEIIPFENNTDSNLSDRVIRFDTENQQTE